MASDNCSGVDTGVAPAPSPSNDSQISSQPLVIDCPDNTVMESTSSTEANATETTSESMSFQHGELSNTHSQEADTEVTGQSCDMLMQTHSSLDLQQCIAGGSTIAQTLQDLVSPGSGIYGTVQAGTMIQSQVAADGSMTIISDGSNQQHQQVQFMTPQLHSPMAVLSTIDARQIQQQVIQQQQQQRPGSAMAIVSVSSPASRSSQSQQGLCQQPTQQTGTVTGFQGIVGQGGTMFGGAGTHLMCATPDSASQSQMDMAMACQQQQQYTIQAAGTQSYQSPMMTGVPQTLQVIQAAGPHQMVQQQCLQQQYMFQTNQVQTLQSVSSGMSLNSPRSSMKNTAVLSIAPQSTGQMLGTRPLVSVSASKGMVTTASQATGYSAMKPMQQSQQHNGPVVIGQLGVMPNTHIMQQNILPQQPRAFSLCQVNQPINLGQMNQQLNLGQVGQQLQFGQQLNFGQINQPLSFGTLNQALNLGQVNQTLNLGSVNQMLGGQTQIRLATMPNFSFNTGQLVGNGQTVLNFQNVPMMQQQLLATQPTTILGSQPLYIRAAEPYVQQQMSTIAVANVQTPTPIRNIIMSPPMQPAVSSTQSQQPLRRLQQVQPNNSIAPATTNCKSATTTSSLSTSVALKQSSKPLKQQATTPTLAAKSIAPATTSSTHRPVKPATAVPVTPKPQSLSVLVPACASSSVATNACPATVQMANTVSVAPSVVSTHSSGVTSVTPASVASSPTASTKKDQTNLHSSAKEKSEVSNEELKIRIKVEDEKKVACDTEIVHSAKMPSKPKRPKILTHVIEGFIIQEASEPFPVHGSSLISQLWSPKMPASTDDGYSSPKSEKDTDCGEDDDHDLEQNESVEAKKQKLNGMDEMLETQLEGTPIVIAPIPNVPEAPVPVEQPAPVEPPSLTCEFCGKRDLVQNFARSRRFCSVTCSKRFSAYSMRKAPDGSVTGRPSNASNKPAVRRPTVLSQAQSRPLAVNSPGPDATGVMTSTATLGPRATDPRVTVIKASSLSSASPSDSWDTEMSSGTGTASQSSGDSSSTSQLSPPALERVERLSCQDTIAATGDDGVIIPSKPLPQWGVQEVYDFIRTLPGCGMYADDFLQQEIDGSALMLLKEDHLMTTMNVKLGPALKICSKISSLKE